MASRPDGVGRGHAERRTVKEPIAPGGVIGILGGGQLGRMTVLAAAPLGYRCHIYTPEVDSPASQVTDLVTVAAYDDRAALATFAESVDVVTYEFENIPIETADFLAATKPLRPSARILATSQHRGSEKAFASAHGIPVAPYHLVANREELEEAAATIGLPCVLKTCRFGYDGKGQAMIRSRDDLDSAWAGLATNDAILEGFISFEKEVSVIVGRGQDKEIRAYPVVENHHENHILATTTAPADVSAKTADAANRIAVTLAEALDLVGLLAVEMFVLPDGGVLMNEIAPRPHNSGHWTQDGSETSQFEQFTRAVTGLPLGSPAISRPTVMQNLIGDAINQWPEIMSEPGAKLHLYGKTESRSGRKMGHVNRIKPN
jgi:5-(carboxyamino)imidazole ribonucleotide synthase